MAGGPPLTRRPGEEGARQQGGTGAAAEAGGEGAHQREALKDTLLIQVKGIEDKTLQEWMAKHSIQLWQLRIVLSFSIGTMGNLIMPICSSPDYLLCLVTISCQDVSDIILP